MAETKYTKTLRDLREASGRSVENIDAVTMIAPQSLADWEAGREESPPSILSCLAALYQLELDVVVAAAKASRELGKDFPEVKNV